MQKDIQKEIVMVHLCYEDGTELCFLTTLNAEILAQKGIILEEDHLPVLDKTYLFNKQQVYKQLPIVGLKSFEIVDKPVYLDEKAEVLSAFI